MKQIKTKLLGIAPYEGMRAAMIQLAQKRNDIELDVFLGDMNQGLSIVNQIDLSSYDAIISRGGTAAAIQEISSVPVIEVPISVYDILRAIKLAEDTTQGYAIVGFPSITENAQILSSLLGHSFDICTIHSAEELDSVLLSLKKRNCNMIICDMISSTHASRYGISSILLSSGEESILSSFEQAVMISNSFKRTKNRAHYYFQLLQTFSQKLAAYASDGRLILSTLPDELSETLRPVFNSLINQPQNQSLIKYKQTELGFYRITKKILLQEQQEHILFFVDRLSLSPAKDSFFIYQNSEDVCAQTGFSHLGSSDAAALQKLQFESCAAFPYPVLITGESGTFKSEAARLIYTGSNYTAWPFITINCQCMNHKSADYLARKEESPLFEPNCTIFFQNIQALDFSQNLILFQVLRELFSSQAHRFIFSYTGTQETLSSDSLYHFLIDSMHCVQISLAPLRERREDIPYLANLYVNHLSLEIARQINGFEPEAMEQLESFSWPHNLSQFYRVLRELATLSQTATITSQDTKKILDHEKTLPLSVSSGLDTSLTLSELNQQYARMVLQEENGNQSIAARRLGISRSTLWRMLK